MRTHFKVLLACLIIVQFANELAAQKNNSSAPSSETERKYEGAEGFGAKVLGGRIATGKELVVTRMDDPPFTRQDMLSRNYQKGTLRWAMHQPIHKRIVFAQTGTIRLWAPIQILDKTEAEYLTFNETRQPITVIGPIRLDASGETVWLNTRFRAALWNNGHRPFKGGPQATGDCLHLSTPANVLVDHCEFSGGADELFNIKNGRGDVTIQWSVFCEAFKAGDFGMSWGDDAAHNYGSLITFDVPNKHNITMHHNLYCNLAKRLPSEVSSLPANPPSKHFEWVNNVVYNWQVFAGSIEADTFTVINGSHWEMGPSAAKQNSGLGYAKKAYVSDSGLQRSTGFWPTENLDTARNPTVLRGLVVLGTKPTEPLHDSPVTTQSRKDSIELVLQKAGVMPLDNLSKANRQSFRDKTGWQGANPDHSTGSLDEYLEWATKTAD